MAQRPQPRAATGPADGSGGPPPVSEARYEIGAVAARCGIHPQTVRQYERLGLIQPARSRGNFRLYSETDLERLQRIQRLVNDLGVNLAGVEVILHMRERIVVLQQEVQTLRSSSNSR